jgi:uncharacterized membrane protein YgcG
VIISVALMYDILRRSGLLRRHTFKLLTKLSCTKLDSFFTTSTYVFMSNVCLQAFQKSGRGMGGGGGGGGGGRGGGGGERCNCPIHKTTMGFGRHGTWTPGKYLFLMGL